MVFKVGFFKILILKQFMRILNFSSSIKCLLLDEKLKY